MFHTKCCQTALSWAFLGRHPGAWWCSIRTLSHIDLKAHLPPGHLCPPVPLRGPQGGAEAPKGGAGREEAAAG